MKKNYYYTFGSLISNLDDVSKLLYDKFDFEFVPHESSYLGEYLKYSGLYADKITIEKNFSTIENEWKEAGFKEYPTLIYVSNKNGKNADKLSKSKYLKDTFSKLEGFKLLNEKIIEEAD